MSLICPKCGNDLAEPPAGYNFRTYGNILLKKRSRRVRKTLTDLHKLIALTLPSNSSTRYFYEFLIRFSCESDEVLLHAINLYKQSGKFYKGMGWKYLSAIVQNTGKDMDKLKEYERKQIGTTPPIREIDV